MDYGSRRRSGAIHITRSFSVVEGMSWEDMEVDMPLEVDPTQRLRCIADEDSRDTGESSRDSGISACSTSTTLLTDFSALRQESNAMYDMDLEVLKNEQMELSDDDYNTSLKLTGQVKTSSKLTVGSKVIRRPRLALQNITNTKYSRDFGNDSPKSSKYSATRKRSVGTLCKSMNSDHQGTRRNALFTIESDSEEPVCALQRVQSTSVLEMSYSVGYVSSPEPTEHYSLSTVQKPQINDRAFRSIDGITLTKLMLRFGEEEFNRHYLLVDCRYPYEYNGGHIKPAINMYDTSEVGKVFYPSDVEQFEKIKNKIPIFYCEYSQKRGPSMARALRRLDRSRNIYPKLDYREIYVLDRGYRKFFNDGHESFCQPSSYMPMDNENHTEDLKKYRFHKSKTYSGTSLSSSRSFRRLEFFPTDS